MEGGAFEVEVGEDLDLVLRGPIQGVARGQVTEPFLAELGGVRS
jgi:hypothetical protein